jgi:ribosome-binding factor A
LQPELNVAARLAAMTVNLVRVHRDLSSAAAFADVLGIYEPSPSNCMFAPMAALQDCAIKVTLKSAAVFGVAVTRSSARWTAFTSG